MTRPDFDVTSDLYDAVGASLLGHDVDDALTALAYVVGECLAQKSDFVVDPELLIDMLTLIIQAYQSVCAPEAPGNIKLN